MGFPQFHILVRRVACWGDSLSAGWHLIGYKERQTESQGDPGIDLEEDGKEAGGAGFRPRMMG